MTASADEVACTPGALKTLINEPATTVDLTLTGSVDASDLFFIADEMPALRTLNLAGATIAEYNGLALRNLTHYPAATIPANAFMGSHLTSLTLPTATTTVGDAAFAGSKLTAVTLTPAVQATGMGVFGGCLDLQTVTTGGATLGDYAFIGCTALTSADLTGNTTLPEGTFQGCSALSSLVASDKLTAIGARAFEGCSGLNTISLGKPLTAMGARVFAQSGLTNPDLTACTSLTAIPAWAFANCNDLMEAFLPANLQVVGPGAFFECSNLAVVTFEAATLGDYCFKGAGMTGRVSPVPEGVQTIGAYALKDTRNITELELPNSLEYLGDGAMEGMTGLNTLRGDAMDHVPALGTAVWAGVDQRNVLLYLNRDYSPEFISAPQWQDFKIVAESTEYVHPDASLAHNLRARFNGPVLEIRVTGRNIGKVELYDVAGTLLLTENCNAEEADIDTSAWQTNIFVVSIVGNGQQAVLKLLR